MTTISINKETQNPLKEDAKKRVRLGIWKRYINMANAREKEAIVWYLKSIIAIPCVFMVITIMAMATLTPNYIWFVGLCVLLFYANVIVHIGGAKSTVFIPLYHATILIMTAVPCITYFLV